MNFFISGFGVLIGTPIAGVLIAKNILYAKIFYAVYIMVAAALISMAHFLLTGPKLSVKV